MVYRMFVDKSHMEVIEDVDCTFVKNICCTRQDFPYYVLGVSVQGHLIKQNPT